MSKICSKFRDGPVVLVSRKIAYTFPLSYAYLAGYLREMGEDVRVLFKPPPSQFDVFAKQIMDLNPVLVGFGSLYPELSEVSKLIRILDDAGRDFPIVIGGQMVSPIPKFAVEISGADFGVIGEGEITLYKLVSALRNGEDPATVKGLAIRQGDDVVLTGQGEIIRDLSKLPPIPYDLFPQDEWLHIGRWFVSNYAQPQWRFNDRVINVHGARGCPFNCNFCYHHSKPRYRPMALAIAEAAEALERFNGNMLYFSDETTLPTTQRVRQMIEGIRTLPRPVEYSVSSRFDILDKIDDNLLLEMRETGCRIMSLGIESGSDRILQIIGKKSTADTIRRGLERLKKAGILPTGAIMIGQYTETVEDVEASISLMRESVRSNRNIQYAFTIATPFPGSRLYEHIFQKGYLRDDKEFYDLYFQTNKGFQYVVNLSAMSNEKLMEMYGKINEAYKEEKLKALKPGIARMEYKMRQLAARHKGLDRRIFSRLRKISVLRKIGFIYLLDKLHQWLYEFIQTRLEKIILRMRGIRQRKR